MAQIDAAAKLGNVLRILYTDGAINQISEDFRDWEMLTRKRVSDQAARSVNFMVIKSLGAASVQWVGQGSSASFPSAQQSTSKENSAGFNQAATTIELEYDLWDRAMGTPEKYIEPLKLEITNKGIAQKRRMSIDLHGDGRGLIGNTHATTAASVVNTDEILVTFAGTADGARYCEFEDQIHFYTSAGVALTTTDLAYSEVLEKDRENNTIVLKPYKSTGVALTAGEAATAASEITASAYTYRVGQSTKGDFSTAINTQGEVNDLTQVMPGFESLFAADNRILHGVNMRGATSGTIYDCNNQPFDMSFIQRGMDKVKTIVGQSRYKYAQCLSSPETITSLIDAQETDRRLISISDDKRGFKGFGYQHGKDQLAFMESEFVRGDRVWILPEGGKDSGVCELHGKDFSPVKVGSQDTYLRAASGGGHDPFVRKYMLGYLTVLTRHPAATLSLQNFT